ncbi:SmtA SAM-dependent methyltransferases [uncultured Caudovirales phage]|uniref:SmtA SAM-dependent methyltransferases n=1 Tax=uncultured Caudovirales phage TaxID=2100421 RepID=A0A6J5N1E6_9CAUD|nr:SmtA SAM-dependent methyltransferases [uncultured Caudovirales phage]
MDAKSTIDLLKLRFYNEWLYNTHIYDEGESPFHKEITSQVVKQYIDPLNIPLDAVIYDMGCGPGYFLDEMKSRNYTNLTGVTLSPEDINLCKSKGHKVHEYDISFLPDIDESVDLIFCRHALEHSPYPIFTLIEYNRILKQNGKLYIEVPAPNCERMHEFNLNHYSILGNRQLEALLIRTGFNVDLLNTFDFMLAMGDKPVKEEYYTVVATKQRPLDIK